VSGRPESLPAGAVLVVADGPAIARGGPAWARSLAAAGRRHRVRLADRGDPAEIAAVVIEARSLRASIIVGAGGPATLGTAAAAAAAVGIPLTGEEIFAPEG
jgi:glycerol dehydrogenase-like iron-containing ADH family enzyme